MLRNDTTHSLKIIAIIQARMGSTRLPGKTLIDICGKPLLEHIIERVKCSKLINDIIVATTERKDDDVIIQLCRNLEIKYFRGNENDVLDRFYQCAKKSKADIIVRITADDPFKDPFVIDKIIRVLLTDDTLDYVSNTIKPTYPEGIDVEAFTFQVLRKTWYEAKNAADREHVTPYIWNHPDIFKIQNVENDIDLSGMRWTLDSKEDLEFAREIYNRLYKPDKIFLMQDVIRVLAKEPQLSKINSGTERFAGYKKTLREDSQ